MTEANTSAAIPPRVTMADIEALIESEFFFTPGQAVLGPVGRDSVQELIWQIEKCGASENLTKAVVMACEIKNAIPDVAPPSFKALSSMGLMTCCFMVLRNGYSVIGKSACASPALFNAEIGRKVAREDAIRQIWPLLGYELRTKLASAGES